MDPLRWTHEAEASLRDIYEYIARNRPATALRTLESILNKTESLTECPTLGQQYPFREGLEVRVLTYGHFQIAYLIEDDDRILVLAVFHGLIFLPPLK